MNGPSSADRLTISVAMCTYNGARYLPEQLKSFLDQQRLPDEIVVCDDGSSDATMALLREFVSKAPFPVRLHVNPENLGYSRNFTQAVNLCSGDVIALSDQDDVWYSRKLLRLEEILAARPEAGGVFSNGDLIDTASQRLAGDLWGSFAFDRASQQRVDEGDAVGVLLKRNVVTGMAFAFRRRWRETLDHMPPHWPHDFWLALMLAAKGRLLSCPEHLLAYRVHTTQQVGVPIRRSEKIGLLRRKGIDGYFAASRARNVLEYTQAAVQFEALLEHAKTDPALAVAPWLPRAAEKARHMRRVVDHLHAGRLSRWISALSHWNSYRLYAPTGLKALLRDLML
jgi:glycosyltransferase involved in cell wall biosynthesis